jgi:streptogramin lyase
MSARLVIFGTVSLTLLSGLACDGPAASPSPNDGASGASGAPGAGSGRTPGASGASSTSGSLSASGSISGASSGTAIVATTGTGDSSGTTSSSGVAGGGAGAGGSGSVASTGSAPAMAGSGPSLTFTEFPIPTASDPGAITAGPDGNIWFTHQSTAPSAIGNVTPDGSKFGLFDTSTTNTGPVAITNGPDGNVWYTKQQGIGRMTPSGSYTEFGTPNGDDTSGLAVGPDGNLWFTEPVANKIGRVAPSGKDFNEFPLPTAASGPTAIALGPDGNLWFTEATPSGNRIGRITPMGTITEFAIPTAASSSGGIAKGADGNLWFSEHDGHKIGRITPSGTITEFPVPSGSSPGSITEGPDGNLWYTEAGAPNAIGRVTTSGSIAEYPVPSADADPDGIALGPDSNIWFTELSTNKIARISNLNGGGNVAPSGNIGATDPLSVGMACMVDHDCVGSGMACGGDVCSWAVTPHVCVLVETADPGWCTASSSCWCAGEGATCSTTNHHCSFTQDNGVDPGSGDGGP